MLRHALAPINARAAHALGLPRTLTPPGVAITFDDGPHPEGTPRILQILAQHGARATFFVVGERVERRPQLAREILAAGHSLQLHGHRHRLQLRVSPASLADDYERGVDAIHAATGTTPTRHRPPYGIYSSAGLAEARRRELEPLLWSTWGKDWRKFTTPERIAARATQNLDEGGVILLHDADFYSASRSHERTADALPRILGFLREREIDTVLAV